MPNTSDRLFFGFFLGNLDHAEDLHSPTVHGGRRPRKLLVATINGAKIGEVRRGERTMPDGSRKRRFSSNPARRAYYAKCRSRRFARRFGMAQFPSRLSSAVRVD